MESEEKHEPENPLLVVEDTTESDDKSLCAPTDPNPVDRAGSGRSFKRWIGTFRQKKPQQPQRYVQGWPDDSQTHGCDNTLSPFHAVQEPAPWDGLSHLSSQLGTVKTTSLSGGSQSVVRSRGTTQSTVNPSTSLEIRRSTETEGLRQVISPPGNDLDALNRGVKRYKVVQEILTTETEYIVGLKALTGLLSIFPTRSQIYYNVQNIRQIHEHFLIELHSVTSPKPDVPDVEIASLMGSLSKRSSKASLSGLNNKSLRARKLRENQIHRLKSIGVEPAEARDVAHVIENLSMSFDAYMMFCSNFELLKQDMTILQESIPDWKLFNQGIEALSKSVAPMERRIPAQNKSMSLTDLLIKPIQRVCRYNLLLQELSKCTPNADCPSSHSEIKHVLDTVRAWASQIDSAAGNPIRAERIQRTMVLQKRLEIPALGALQDVYRQLGPMVLCGVLHVTYQSPERLTGAYMVCVLFDHYFLLAKQVDDSRRLEAVACMYVWDLKIDSLRNGKGICCYGCLFSWKLVFPHCDGQYELVLSASTGTEEKQWTSEIMKSTKRIEPVPWEPRRYSLLTLEVVPFERSAGLGRRSSVHSLSTSCATNNLRHVIIRKTHYPNSPEDVIHQIEGEIERPKVSSPQGAVSIAPRREDRIRLEQSISEIYTHDALPFPGMVLGQSDKRPRTRFSIHAKFTRRSASFSPTKVRSAGVAARSGKVYRDDLRESRDNKKDEALDPFPLYNEKEIVLLDVPQEPMPPTEPPPKPRNVSKGTSTSGQSSTFSSKSYLRIANASRQMFNSFWRSVSRKKTKRPRQSMNSDKGLLSET